MSISELKSCKQILAPALVAFCLFGGACVAGENSGASDNFKTDGALVHFLMKSDPVLSRVTGGCKNISVTRYKSSDGLAKFNIKGFCETKNIPEEDLDCPGYNIDVTGTIDNSIQATARKISLTLVCGS